VELRSTERLVGASVVEILIHPGDAMGANLAIAVGEEFKAHFASILEATWMAPIVTNEPFGTATTAHARIPFLHLAGAGLDGALVASRIAMLSQWAMEDPHRRVTHQKGVLNGICAVFGTLSQDTRALSVALMADCAQRHHPCVTWTCQDGELRGEFQGPVPCGTVGGTGPYRPETKLFLRWMAVATAGQLAEVAASVGLLSNLAALRAIATDSLYAGHMNLHQRKQRESGPRN